MMESVSVKALFPSPTNPRKKFDQEKLDELTASVQEKGILSPLLVRKVKSKYEVVAGERRYRAAIAADLAEVPCLVRELTDEDVLEMQLVENLQRDDLDPLEEAAAYRRMLDLQDGDHPKYTVPMLAEKIGKSRRYVYRRLKLLEAPESIKRALAEGEVKPEVASIIAKIPDPEMRERVAELALGSEFCSPMTYKEVEDYIAENCMRSLESAPFGLEDEQLLPDEGACSKCIFMVGNNRELYGDAGRSDVCANPSCYIRKCDAAWKRTQESAEAEGKKLVPESEAQKIFAWNSTELAWNSPYSKLSQSPKADLLTPEAEKVKKKASWKKILQASPGEVPIYLAKAPTGQVIELVNTSEALAAAKQGPSAELFRVDARSERDAWEEQRKKRDAAEKLRKEKSLEAMKALPEAVAAKGLFGENAWQLLYKQVIHCAGYQGRRYLGSALDLHEDKSGDYLDALIAMAPAATLQQLQALTVCALVVGGDFAFKGIDTPRFKVWADYAGLDMKEITKRVADRRKDARSRQHHAKSSRGTATAA